MLNFWEKLGIGITAGVAGGTWVGFLISLMFGRVVAWPALLAFMVISSWFLVGIKIERPTKIFLITFLGWGAYLVKLFSQMLVEKADGIWAGGSNVWGDWALHIGFVANWLYGNNFPVQNPNFAGVRLAYPFLFDFASAILVKLGLSISGSFEIPGMVFGLVIVVLLFSLTVRITKKQATGAIAVAVFMLSGGLGWIYLVPGQTIFRIPERGVRELTQSYEANIQWVNFVISEMVPQRGIAMGISLALSVFILWWMGEEKDDYRYFLGAGIMAGLVPFFHAHTFMVLIAVSGCLFLTNRKKYWWYFFIPAGILALPQFAYFMPQVSGYGSGFMRWQPGWTAHVQKDNWIWFWVKNIGLMTILIPISWIDAWKKHRKLFWIYVPFAVVFVAANLWIFQPWENDNSKLLRFWYLASSVLVANWMVSVSEKGWWQKVIVAVLLVLITLSGAIDAGSWLDFEKNKLQMWSRTDIELADRVRELTPETAVFLTNDNHNHWVVDLAGRKIVLGFRGWLWSWGINYSTRENDVRKMFAGDLQTPQLLTQYDIDYVIIGPGEKNNFNASESYYSSRYPLLFDWYGQKIFDVRGQR